jgi:LPXTG-motif cell wall-anchored protein
LALPSTGVDSAGMLALGTGLAMVGLVAAFAGRRRRATT